MTSLLVTHTVHFARTPDGAVYSLDPAVDFDFFTRYLHVFDRVAVAARVARVASTPPDARRADGAGVEFADLPNYQGPWQFVQTRGRMSRLFAAALERVDAVCLRVPCAHATLAWKQLIKRRRPFGLEITGNPWQSLGPGSYRSILRPAARWSVSANLRRQCRSACATAYVTRETIQRDYPPDPAAFTTFYSSIELPAEAIASRPRTDFDGAHRIIYVGTLAVLYKAPDVLIRSVARLNRANVKLTIVGDGRMRAELQALARSLGIESQVTFTGLLPGAAAVRDALDAEDLFVLPSRTEGLPRAMIEAMARGLPCIGSTAGGIPELLALEDLVPPADVDALAEKIAEFLDDPARMHAASARNLSNAKDYVCTELQSRRNAFLTELRRRCETASHNLHT